MKRLLLIAAAMFCALSTAYAVPVVPPVWPHVTFVNASGQPCAGCKLWTYVAGTTTALATYTDANGVSVNTNPITLDAAGGANIWVGRNSYKFILKDALGNTIWTVDQVNATSLFPCGPANTVQISNSAVTGLNCDANIFIDPINHTLNVGIMSVNHVTIGALSTPTSWFLDTTTPATACASIGCSTTTGTVTSVSVVSANGVSGTVANPTTTPAITLALGNITPTSVAIGGGIAMTGNQGTGLLVQHATGTTTPNNCAKFDAAGNVIDSGASCAIAVTLVTGTDLIGSRSLGVVYHNTTGYGLIVSGNVEANTGGSTAALTCTIGATSSPALNVYGNGWGATAAGMQEGFNCPVPNGDYYTINASGDIHVGGGSHWFETQVQ